MPQTFVRPPSPRYTVEQLAGMLGVDLDELTAAVRARGVARTDRVTLTRWQAERALHHWRRDAALREQLRSHLEARGFLPITSA